MSPGGRRTPRDEREFDQRIDMRAWTSGGSTTNQAGGDIRITQRITHGPNATAVMAAIAVFVFAPLAIVLGHIARRQTRRTDEGSYRLALAALIAGYLITAVYLVALAVIVPQFMDVIEPQPGNSIERLAKPASVKSGPIAVSVTSVQVNEKATVLHITVVNSGNDSASLPVQTAQLSVPGSATLPANGLATEWMLGDVGAKAEFAGQISFNGALRPETKEVTLTFVHVIVTGRMWTISVKVQLN